MRITKLIKKLVFVFLLISLQAYPQNQYSILSIDLLDRVNSGLIHYHYTDNLGSVLIDGYLRGKIKGYEPTWRPRDRTLKDTLSKPLFLERMRRLPDFPDWDRNTEYSEGDRIEFEGYVYDAVRAGKGFNPDNREYWSKTYSSHFEYWRADEANSLDILSYFKIIESDTIHYPQMVTISIMDFTVGAKRQMIRFYYDDVLNYLNRLSLPVLYKSKIGYVGKGSFVLDGENRFDLLVLLKDEIKKGNLRVKKEMISNLELYNKWLADSAESRFEWTIYQQLKTRNLIANHGTKTNVGNYGFRIADQKPFLNVPISEIEKILINEVPKFYSYAQAIHEKLLLGRLRIEEMNGAKPLKATELKFIPKIKSTHFILEQYTVDEDTLALPLRNLLSSIWLLVKEAQANKTLKFTELYQSPYPAPYKWPKVVSWYQDGYLNFNGPISYWPDTIAGDKIVSAISVVYRKHLTASEGFTKSFEPIRVTFESQDPNEDNYCTFKWTDIKSLLLKKSPTEFKLFIDQIERGDLNFSRSQLIYGLMEEE